MSEETPCVKEEIPQEKKSEQVVEEKKVVEEEVKEEKAVEEEVKEEKAIEEEVKEDKVTEEEVKKEKADEKAELKVEEKVTTPSKIEEELKKKIETLEENLKRTESERQNLFSTNSFLKENNARLESKIQSLEQNTDVASMQDLKGRTTEKLVKLSEKNYHLAQKLKISKRDLEKRDEISSGERDYCGEREDRQALGTYRETHGTSETRVHR